MPTLEKSPTQNGRASGKAVLQLIVHDHPGVMSHVCGLFARRAFNLDGIACLPEGDGARSRVWLAVADDGRLEQLIKQLRKLRDVIEVSAHGADHEVFLKLEDFFKDRSKAAAKAGPTDDASNAV